MRNPPDLSKFKAIFKNAIEAILVVDKSGVIIDNNPAAKKLFERRKLQGLKIENLVSIANVVKEDLKSSRGEIRVDSKYLEFTKSSGFTKGTKIFFFRDITDRKVEERRREHFLGIVGHELKNPLAVIKALAHLTQRAAGKREVKISSFAHRINEKVDTLTRLINELLDVTRVRQGKFPLKLERLNFHKFMTKTVNDFRLLHPDYEITLLGKGPNALYIDRERMIQVLTNLLRNAVKYSEKIKKVEVNLKTLKKDVQVNIKDYGIGIPDSEQKKVFDLYYRKPGVLANPSGLGVGLYISKEIIKAHQGKIEVKSVEGQGSEFIFTLPLKGVSKNQKESITYR